MRRAGIVLLILLMFAVVPAMAACGKCVVHRGEWVWLRDQPTPDARTIGQIRYGTEVDIREIRNQYAHVVWENGDGWADVSYFLLPHNEQIYVTTCNVNKRETPDGRFMTKIRSGVRVSVLGWRYSKKGELWAYTYKGGYVKAEYLETAK